MLFRLATRRCIVIRKLCETKRTAVFPDRKTIRGGGLAHEAGPTLHADTPMSMTPKQIDVTVAIALSIFVGNCVSRNTFFAVLWFE